MVQPGGARTGADAGAPTGAEAGAPAGTEAGAPGGADAGRPGATTAGNADVGPPQDATGLDPARAGAPRRELSPAWAKRLDVGITVAGLIVATLLALVLATIEAFYAPLRFMGVRVPVSLIMAVVTNPLLGWFASTTTRRRLAALFPAAAWCAVWILAAGRTAEGDLIITGNNWVGLLTLFAGPLAFAIGIYMAGLRQRLGPPGTRGGAAGSKPAGP